MKQVKQFSDLIGLELVKVEGSVGSDEMSFEFSDGNKVKLYHSQDCCESVSVEDIDGEIQDLVGGIVVEFEEVSNPDYPAPEGDYVDSYTWTFYKVATTKGFVNIRWLGESNGYYSESVYATAYTGNPDDHDRSGGGEGWRSIN